jgi:carbon-monoxide dehydrogenase medium subunit
VNGDANPREGCDLKAPPFAYLRAETTDHALAVLAAHGDEARVLAGGQSLIASLNLRLSEPRVLIDINRLGFDGISEAGGAVTIGALCRHVTVERSDIVRRYLPLLAQAVPHIAHPAIRNRGTIGGSLALNDPAAEYPACVLALGANLVLRGPAGVRRVAADAFFKGLYATAIDPGELLEAVEFPAPAADSRAVFLELARRHGDYAIVGLAAQGRMVGDRATDLRCVFFGVGDGPVLARAASAAACEGGLASCIPRAQAALGEDLDCSGDLNAAPATRLHLARVLLGRALTQFGRGA